jgi:hypothetical protein
MNPNQLKLASATVLLAVMLLSAFPLVLDVNAESASSNLLVNSDFESGTLNGWANVNGSCAISDGTVHSGSYSAYLSDRSYDSMMNQTVMLPATDSLYTSGWIYPTRVGNLGDAFCASAQINYYFYDKTSMAQKFIVGAVWSWNNWHANNSWYLGFLMPFNASSWNYFSLNLTDAIYSHFTDMDFSNIVLYSVVAWYHFSNGNPGEFYVDDLYLSSDATSAPLMSLSPKPVNLSLSTNAESTELGYILDLNGALTTLEDKPLAGKQVILSSMIPGTAAWTPFSSVTTNGNGDFSASWIPTATGNFMVKAEWEGDENYSAAYDIKNVSVLRGSEENVFMAESNSTLSSLSLNSTSNEISFTVSGPSGTTGYVRFLLSKSLLNDPADVKVYKDGVLTNCTVTSVDDQTILYIVYSHSSHEMRISLPEYAEAGGSENSGSAVSTILLYVFGGIVIAAVIALPLLVVALLRKPKSTQQ